MLNSICVRWAWCWEATNKKQDKTYPAIATIVLAIFTLLWLLWRVKKSKRLVPPLPPGPIGLPLVGYLPFLGTNLLLRFDELTRLYGPIYKLRLGSKLFVVISSPRLVKEVVRDQDTIFANHYPSIASLVASYGGIDMVFLPYGPEWRKTRKIFVREMLSNTSISNSYAWQRTEVNKSIRYVYDKTGQPINIGELTFLTATNSVMSMVWGGTLEGEKGADIGAELRALVAEMMVLLGRPNISDLFTGLARFDLQGIERKTNQVVMWIDRLLDSVIEKRINDKSGTKVEKKNDFLQYLLDLTKHDSDSASMSRNQLKALLVDVVIGGTETTSTTLEWAMAELIQHPEAAKRVHQELDAVVGLDNSVEESHLPKLQYVDAVIKETMRLHPALPLLVPRCASESSIVGGYSIPKGTRVFLNMWTIHRDPDLWDSALEFRPERFLSDPAKFDYKGNNVQYLPFGSGRRLCAGLPLAEKMLTFMLASFLHSFEWNLPSGSQLDFSAKFGIVVKKMNPLIAIPTPRLSKLQLYS